MYANPKGLKALEKTLFRNGGQTDFFQFIILKNLKRKNLKLSAIYEKGLCLQKRLVDVLIKNHQLTFESGGAGSGDLFIFVACNCLPGGLKWSSKNEHKKNILI